MSDDDFFNAGVSDYNDILNTSFQDGQQFGRSNIRLRRANPQYDAEQLRRRLQGIRKKYANTLATSFRFSLNADTYTGVGGPEGGFPEISKALEKLLTDIPQLGNMPWYWTKFKAIGYESTGSLPNSNETEKMVSTNLSQLRKSIREGGNRNSFYSPAWGVLIGWNRFCSGWAKFNKYGNLTNQTMSLEVRRRRLQSRIQRANYFARNPDKYNDFLTKKNDSAIRMAQRTTASKTQWQNLVEIARRQGGQGQPQALVAAAAAAGAQPDFIAPQDRIRIQNNDPLDLDGGANILAGGGVEEEDDEDIILAGQIGDAMNTSQDQSILRDNYVLGDETLADAEAYMAAGIANGRAPTTKASRRRAALISRLLRGKGRFANVPQDVRNRLRARRTARVAPRVSDIDQRANLRAVRLMNSGARYFNVA